MGLRLWLLLVMVLAMPVAAQTSGYSGQESREIKALSAEETADLLAGRGIGAARAAELNHFPSPAHVLELREQLVLSAEQIRAVQETFDRMSAAAKPLGVEIVAAERVSMRPSRPAPLIATYYGRRPPPLPSCRERCARSIWRRILKPAPC
jgi:hypothetical protein